MSPDRSKPEQTESGAPREAPDPAYVPPAADDIDTTYSPAEAAGGVANTSLGAEESARWH
jgi:hypothetical protein